MTKEENYTFLEKEHEAGFHDEIVAECSSCAELKYEVFLDEQGGIYKVKKENV